MWLSQGAWEGTGRGGACGLGLAVVLPLSSFCILAKGAFESEDQDTARSGQGLNHQLGREDQVLGTPARPPRECSPDVHSTLPGCGRDL